jgi:hypothetical protein
MVLQTRRRVALAWGPEGPASTQVGRKEICRPANNGNKLEKRFYQLNSEVASFRSQVGIPADQEAGFR